MGQAAVVAMMMTIAAFVCAKNTRGYVQQVLAAFGFALAALALGAAFASEMIGVLGIVTLLVFGGACYAYGRLMRPKAVVAMTVVIFVAAILLATHQIPGFRGLPLLAPITICEGCQKFWLIGHLDKPFVGLILFVIALGGMTLRPKAEIARPPFLQSSGVTVIAVAVVTVVVMGVLSLMNVARWAPKAPDTTTVVMFVALNLLFTSFAEEVFFRMFLHDAIRRGGLEIFDRTWKIIALSTLLFGLAHAGGGPLLMLGATLAGLGYGYVYEKTKRIECAIAAHFGVNAIHFFLFSYPRLAP